MAGAPLVSLETAISGHKPKKVYEKPWNADSVSQRPEARWRATRELEKSKFPVNLAWLHLTPFFQKSMRLKYNGKSSESQGSRDSLHLAVGHLKAGLLQRCTPNKQTHQARLHHSHTRRSQIIRSLWLEHIQSHTLGIKRCFEFQPIFFPIHFGIDV